MTAERFKLPQSDSIHIERFANKRNDNLVYLMSSHVSASKATFLYLVEIPANLSLDKTSVTFLGSTAPLSRPPMCLTDKRILLLSEMESSEIVELTESKSADPQRPFILPMHKFENFGIIQQIDIDREKKQLLLNSYKQSASLQSFQKGILLESLSQFKVDLTQLKRIEPISRGQSLTLAFFFTEKTIFYHFGDSFQIFYENKVQFDEELIHFAAVDNDHYVAVSRSSVKIIKLWDNPKLVTQQLFPEDSGEVLAADSFCLDVIIGTEKSINFYTFSNGILQITQEIKTEAEPKFVRCLFRRVFVGYWLEEDLDSFSLAGHKHIRINLGVKGVHSMKFFYSKAEESVYLLGMSNGTVIHKVFDKQGGERISQVLVVGKQPVNIREVSLDQYIALSDESAMLYFSNSSTTVDLVPLCHSEIVDLHHLNYQAASYYLLATKNSLSFNVGRNNTADNCRLKAIKLKDSKAIDRFIREGEYMVSCHSDLDLCCAEICVHDLHSTKMVHKHTIPGGQVEALLKLHFQDRTYFLAGLSIPIEGADAYDLNQLDNLTGQLRLFLLRKGELIELMETNYEKPVRGLHLLEGGLHLLVNVGYSTLKVFKLEQKLKKLPDKSVEVAIPQLKEIHQQKFFFLIDSISVVGNHILMTDYYWMAHVILFENVRFPRFKSVGRLSSISHEIIGAELLSPTRFVVSDKAGNLMVYSLADVGSNEVEFVEFQEKNLMYLGEQIFSFKKDIRGVPIKFTDEYFKEFSSAGEVPFILFGGCSGGLYVFYEIPRRTYSLLEDLQRAILVAIESESCILKRKEYRKVSLKNSKTKPAMGIIDGDVLFSLLRMPDDHANQIIRSMKHLNKPSLSSVRNLLRFMHSNPVN